MTPAERKDLTDRFRAKLRDDDGHMRFAPHAPELMFHLLVTEVALWDMDRPWVRQALDIAERARVEAREMGTE